MAMGAGWARSSQLCRVRATLKVEFVDHENARLRRMCGDVADAIIFDTDGAGRVNDVEEDVDAFEGVADFVVEIGDEFARLGLKDAGVSTKTI